MPMDTEVSQLLAAARERGQSKVVGMAVPGGLDHFVAYVGLISSALELGKLIKTEERDLKVIQNHYEIETLRIRAAFSEIEAAMTADFQRDESLKAKTFEAITALISAGQYEIASEFHKRLMEGLKRPALESILEGRNAITGAKNSRMTLR